MTDSLVKLIIVGGIILFAAILYRKELYRMKVFHPIAIVGSWLTISPLFYYFSRRWEWGSKTARIILTLISPLFLLLYLISAIWIGQIHYSYNREHRFAKAKTLERITEAPFPDFTVVEYLKGETHFTGDYNDALLIKFQEIPSESFYQTLDSLSDLPHPYWWKTDDEYTYNRVWG